MDVLNGGEGGVRFREKELIKQRWNTFESVLLDLSKDGLPFSFRDSETKTESQAREAIIKVINKRASGLARLKGDDDARKGIVTTSEHTQDPQYFLEWAGRLDISQRVMTKRERLLGAPEDKTLHLVEWFGRFLLALEDVVTDEKYKASLHQAIEKFSKLQQAVENEDPKYLRTLNSDLEQNGIQDTLIYLMEIIWTMNVREFRTFVVQVMGERLTPTTEFIEKVLYNPLTTLQKMSLWRLGLSPRNADPRKEEYKEKRKGIRTPEETVQEFQSKDEAQQMKLWNELFARMTPDERAAALRDLSTPDRNVKTKNTLAVENEDEKDKTEDLSAIPTLQELLTGTAA
jgi:hypothetical protein